MKARFQLRELMFEKHIRTIGEISKESGVHRNIVSRIYNNQSKQVHLETIAKLCNALNCEPDDLIVVEED